METRTRETVLADFGTRTLVRFTCECGQTVELCLTPTGRNARRRCLDCRNDEDRAIVGWTPQNTLS